MADPTSRPNSVAEYYASCPPKVRRILERIRRVFRRAAPDAIEVLSYGMPTFRRGRVLVHFMAFQKHVGLFPPVRGDAALLKALAPYLGEKGNLRFPLDQPMPWPLIERIAALRAAQEPAKAVARPARAAAPARPRRVRSTATASRAATAGRGPRAATGTRARPTPRARRARGHSGP